MVGTPGRVMDHLRRGTLSVENVKLCVLDEADEMLALGFLEDMETILAELPDAAPTGVLLGHHAAAHRRAGPAVSEKPGPCRD